MLFLLELIYGVVIGYKFRDGLSQALGSSQARDVLSKGYDSNVWADLSRYQGFDLSSVLMLGFIALPVFLLLSTFVRGGIVGNMTEKKSSLSRIFKNGRKLFRVTILTSLIGLLATIVLCAVLWVPFLLITGNPLDYFHSDKTFIIILLIGLFLSGALAFLVYAWKVRAISYSAQRRKSYMKRSFRSVILDLPYLVLLYIVTLVLLVLIVLLFKWAIGQVGPYSTWGVVFGQFLIVGLCKLRIFYLGAMMK